MQPPQDAATAAPAAIEGPVAAPPPPSAPPTMQKDRRSRLVGWRSQDVIRAAALVIAMYVALRLIWFAQTLVLVAFLGVLFGLAVTAGVDRLQRFRVPRGLGAAIITFGSIGLIVAFFAWSAPTLRGQSRELRNKLPEAIDKLDSWVQSRQGGLLGALLGAGSGSGGSTTAPAGDSARPDTSDARVQSTLPPAGTLEGQTVRRGTPDSAAAAGRANGAVAGGSLRDRILGGLSGAKSYFFGFITSTFSVFGGLLIVIFLSIYVAADPGTYHDGLMHLFPHRSRRRAGEVLTAMATVLRRWLVTQLIAMVAIGTVTTVVLLLLGIPAAFPLGVLAGLLEFIPTIGPVLSALPAVAMGFVDSPQKAMYVGIAYVGIQLLENHLLIPLLMKEGVDLPPALTIIAQAVMALVFGFLGLLVAVPMLAATMVAVKMLYVEDVVGDDISVLDDLDDG